MTFSLAPNSSSDITLRPSSGLIGPGAHQVFLISTYPKGTSWRQHIFYLNFNFYPQYLKEVSMQSREEPLDLKLDTHKSIYFKPTWVGCSSTSNFTFHNPSRLPLQFEWRVSQEHQKVLAVQPSKGTIHPNENLTLTWIFSPLEEIKYLFRVGIWVWEARQSQKTKPQATVHYRIRLVGMGVTGCLSVSRSPVGGGARTQEGGKVVPSPKKAGNKVEDKIRILAPHLRSASPWGMVGRLGVGGTPRS